MASAQVDLDGVFPAVANTYEHEHEPFIYEPSQFYKFHLAGQVILTDISENLHMKKTIDMHRYLQLNC